MPGQGETAYDPDANYQPAAFYQPTAAGKEHQTRYAYDERHRLASITHVLCATSQRPCSGGNVLSSVLASAYAYDGNDNRTTATDDNGGGAVTRHYCYDARNQLVAVSASSPTCASGATETYAYDAAGNRTSAAGRSFAYGTSNKLATCSGTACNPVFDADGRLTRVTLASGTWSYQYDADGRLTAACKASACATGIARLDVAYDAEGNRTRITETPASGAATVTDLTYEGGRVVRETATTGATVITRAFTVDEAGAIVRMAVAGDPVALHNGTYLVTWNGHGDALALERLDPVTGTLTVANRFSYSTWGAPTLTLHNGYGDLGFRYRYVGQWGVAWDGHAGADLLAMRARHYSPELGRFLQPDPARAEENPYAYAGNSPVTKVDPSGRLFWFVVGAIVVSAVIDSAFYLATTPEQKRNWQGWAQYVVIGELFTFVPVAKLMRWGGRLTKLLVRPPTVITRIDPNKLWHIFGDPGHKLAPLVAKFGSQEAAYRAVEGAAQRHVTRYGIRGNFRIAVMVAGQRVTVVGTVVNGVVRIGTFFIE